MGHPWVHGPAATLDHGFCCSTRKEEPCFRILHSCVLVVVSDSVHPCCMRLITGVSHSFPLTLLAFRICQPIVLLISFWFCSLCFLMPLCLNQVFCSCFYSSDRFSVLHLTHFCFLYPPPPIPTLCSFGFFI